MAPELLSAEGVDTAGMSPTQRFIIQVGVVAALFAYLLFWVTHDVSAQIEDTNRKMADHMAATAAIVVSLQQQAESQRVLIIAAQQTCVSVGKTQAERAACFGDSRGSR